MRCATRPLQQQQHLRRTGPFATTSGLVLLTTHCRALRRQTTTAGLSAPVADVMDALAFPRNFTAEAQLRHTRNFGIIAHIDAGKTTTTERMLYYAGMQRRIGEVDRGNTTTDFMPEEMERGISITAAAVSFMWNKHRVNLIDTPGHVDFSVEVQRSMRVIDGVVCVFDAKVGVQAQSYTVLHMARLNRAPCIAFMNKMDKSDANFELAVNSIRAKLGVVPVLMQLPLRTGTGECVGVIDLAQQTVVTFEGKNGELVTRCAAKEDYVCDMMRHGRKQLVDFLATHDVTMMECYLNLLEKHDGNELLAESSVPADAIYAATKALLCAGAQHGAAPGSTHLRIMPIFLGASRRNLGVQTLMDAVVHLLPCPLERPCVMGVSTERNPIEAPGALHPNTYVFVFKVCHFPDPKKGNEPQPFVFFRVFSGKVTAKTVLYNRRTRRSVAMERLFTLQADKLHTAPSFTAGSVGGAFLTDVQTGDTLACTNLVSDDWSQQQQQQQRGGGGAFINAKKHKQVELDLLDKAPEEFSSFEPLVVAPSVLSHAIEATSQNWVESLRTALRRIELEDPSLRVTENQYGQIVVSGMGELHLDIVLSKLRREYSVNCDLTKAFVSYREGIRDEVRVDNVIAAADGVQLFLCDVVLRPLAVDAPGAEGMCVQPHSVSLVFDPAAAESFVASCVSAALESSASSSSGGGGAGGGGGGGGGGSAGSLASERKARDQLVAIRRACNDALAKTLKMGPLAKVELDGFEVRVTRMERGAPSWDSRRLETAVTVMLSQVIRRLGGNAPPPKTKKQSKADQAAAAAADAEDAESAGFDWKADAASAAAAATAASVTDAPRARKNPNSVLLEPIMKLHVHLTDNTYTSDIMANLSTKQALSIDMESPDERTTEITALVPLRFITRYSTEARAIAKGNVYFWSELHLFRKVIDEQLEARILKTLM